jgi:hypothetical protein
MLKEVVTAQYILGYAPSFVGKVDHPVTVLSGEAKFCEAFDRLGDRRLGDAEPFREFQVRDS